MPTLRWRAVWTGVCLLAVTTARPASAQGVTRNVGVGGDLQAAIDVAAPGDTIVLPAGATFTGNFVLPVKSGTGVITIRTAADSRQPAAGVRVTPAHKVALAKIQSPNQDPALRTAGAAHHWRLMLLEFGPNSLGFGEILQLGQADSTQSSLSQVPYSLVVDRVYIHGDPVHGQKRGLALNSGDTQVINSYICDMKSVNQDSQAIAAMNGPGPYLIENNYLEAAAENMLFGGVDPSIPNLMPSDITFRHNYLTKPVSWKNAIVSAPTGVSAVESAGGSLPPGTYGYRIVAESPTGPTATARSNASAEVTVTTTATGGAAVAISWAPVSRATSYRVYGRAAGGENQFWTTTSASFVDTGAAGMSGTPAAGTVWTVKNLFELKNARRVLVEGNVMENNWMAAQPGYAIVLTPRNSGGQCGWCAIDDITFRYNTVRHVAAAINILGFDNNFPSGQARGLAFTDNLFWDVNKTAWGGNGWFVQMGDGPADITIDHNTVDHNGTALTYAYGTLLINGFTLTNNLTKHNTYGIFGVGATTGNPIIAKYFPGSVITSNVIADGVASKYPAGNIFPTSAFLMSQYVAPASGNYTLVAGSPYAGLGADIAAINAAAAIALGGDTRGGVDPVQIVTTSLPTATVGAAFSTTLDATGGSGSYVWTLAGALPNGIRLDSAAGVLSGTPTQYGSWPLTVKATDASDSSSSAVRGLTLSVRPTSVVILGTQLAQQTMGVAGATTMQATGGTGTYGWRLVSGSLPPGMTLDATNGTIYGTPTTPGSYAFVVEAADTSYPDILDQASESIVVVPPPVSIAVSTFPSGVVGSAYWASASASGGAGPLTWSVAGGTLPPGLGLNAQTGAVSGTPTSAGSWTFSLRAADSLYPTNAATASFGITVTSASAGLTITTTTIPDARRTVAYATTILASGGTATRTWRIVAGSLPAGITLSTSGLISGKSGYIGCWTFTVEVKDSANATATRQYTLMVRTLAGWKPNTCQ